MVRGRKPIEGRMCCTCQKKQPDTCYDTKPDGSLYAYCMSCRAKTITTPLIYVDIVGNCITVRLAKTKSVILTLDADKIKIQGTRVAVEKATCPYEIIQDVEQEDPNDSNQLR